MNSKKFHNNSVDLNQLWYQSHKELIRGIAIELNSKDKIDELTEKFLGTQIKIKKFRDPNEPKKPKTGFQFFCDEFRPKIKEDNPELKLGGIMKELGKLWKTYSDEQKEQYVEKYNEAKYNYEAKLDEYNESLY